LIAVNSGSRWNGIKRHWFLYLLLLPAVVYFIVLRFYPMFLQMVLAFKDYRLMEGVWGSPWVGLDNFRHIFEQANFGRVLRNTIEISLLRLGFGFIPPLLLAIFLYDLSKGWLRKVSQTILYIPHFFSWVVIYGIVFALFSHSGFMSLLIEKISGANVEFLMDSGWFRPLLIGSGIWKELGWSTIIYLAALTAIDQTLYEAAKIDGAGPWRRTWHVTLPGLRSIVIFLLTLSLGNILYAGGEQVLLFYSPATYDVGDVIDTWIYRQGISQLQYSLATAASLFQSLFGFLLVIGANYFSKKYAQTGIW